MNRNTGLDIVRSLAMIGVVGLHICGALFGHDIGRGNTISILIYYSLLYCSVNLFAILSGYLMVDKVIKTKSILGIWEQTLFWSVLITIGATLYLPSIGIKELVTYVFPYSTDRLWYITCYTFLFFMIPILNFLLKSFDKLHMKKLLITLFVLLSVVTTFSIRDNFHIVSAGYSPVWLAFMYLIGGYIKQNETEVTIKRSNGLILITNAAVLTASALFIMKFVSSTDKILLFYRYSSPFIVVNTLILFMLIKNWGGYIKSLFAKKIFAWMSSVSLGVYIIHAHPFMLDKILIYENLSFLTDKLFVVNFALIVFCQMLIFSIAGLLEYIRQKLFAVLNIDKFNSFLGSKFDKVILKEAVNKNVRFK